MEDLSPWSPYFNTPLDSSLDIPLFDCLDENAMFTDPNNNPYNERVIFHLPADWDDVPEVTAQSKSLPKLDASYLAAISPSSPLLDSFDPSQLTSVAPQIRAPTMVKSTASCRKVTVERVLGETAATQMRNDINAPTSRKEVRTVFARKRGRSAACGDEDEFDDYVLCPNPMEQDLIEQKHR